MDKNCKVTNLEQAKFALDNMIEKLPNSQVNKNHTWLQKKYKEAKQYYNDLLHNKKVNELCLRGNTLSIK